MQAVQSHQEAALRIEHGQAPHRYSAESPVANKFHGNSTAAIAVTIDGSRQNTKGAENSIRLDGPPLGCALSGPRINSIRLGNGNPSVKFTTLLGE